MVGVSSVQVLFLLPAEILSVVLNLHGAGQRTTTVAIHAESRLTSVIIIIIKKGIMTGISPVISFTTGGSVGDLCSFLLVKLGINPDKE